MLHGLLLIEVLTNIMVLVLQQLPFFSIQVSLSFPFSSLRSWGPVTVLIIAFHLLLSCVPCPSTLTHLLLSLPDQLLCYLLIVALVYLKIWSPPQLPKSSLHALFHQFSWYTVCSLHPLCSYLAQEIKRGRFQWFFFSCVPGFVVTVFDYDIHE